MSNKHNPTPFIWLEHHYGHETVDDKRLDLLLKLQSLARMLQLQQEPTNLEPIMLQNYGVLMEELINELLTIY